jgi:GT2 family glycosyltransferase
VVVTLDIIMVNRNSGSYLRECLTSISIAEKTGISLERVVVVDDLSSDDSLRGIETIDLPVKCIRNRVRTGYGRSCNIGAAHSNADYLLFINTDVSLCRDSLTTPVSFLEDPHNTDIGIIGVKLLGRAGEVSRSCVRFATPTRFLVMAFGLDRILPCLFLSHQMKEWDHLSTREVDQVIGAFTLIRGSVFERLAGYDERFFVYWEDQDISLRARQLGYKSVYLSSAVAIHEGGATANRVKAESLFFMLRSRIQYGFKHFGIVRGAMVLATTAILEPFSRLIFAGWNGSIGEIRETVKAFVRFWRAIPGMISGG